MEVSNKTRITYMNNTSVSGNNSNTRIKEVFKKIVSIDGLEEDSGEVIIRFEDGSQMKQFHEQDCCENVWLSQVDGTVSRHIGAELYNIQEKVSYDDPNDPEDYDSCTWTFYTMETSKGRLDWRFQGVSNGYYSETVECQFIGEFVEL
jgi:hypothetical protein